MELLLFRGGTLIDGTGSPPVTGGLLVAGDRIAEVGSFPAPQDARVVDCADLMVAPGFIDAHSHSDLQVLENRPEKIRQGVTTEVVGNCGFSAYPAETDRQQLHEFANGIFCGSGGWGWRRARDYLAEADRKGKVNVCSLVGHGSLRIWQAGNRLGPLPEHALDAMEQELSAALSDGACGFSTGLMYAPGESAPWEELERLCRVVARHDKTYATHMRNYSDRLIEAVEEQIRLARHSGCRLQISHFQAVGAANWERQASALEVIDNARAAGIDVAFDCYPYVAGSTVMTQLLPQWALEGGPEGLLCRLADPPLRWRIESETSAQVAQRWEDLLISAIGSQANQLLVGLNLAQIAEMRGREPVEVVMDLLSEESGNVNILEFNQSESNLRQTLTHPLSAVISDGFYVKGRPHPRLYGTFPLLLGQVCRDRGWLTLSEAVRKITDYPAQRFGIAGRGRLRRGYFADIVVFDSKTIGSPATYENPEQPPTGIRQVFRNGCPLV